MGDLVIGGIGERRLWETEEDALRYDASSSAIVKGATHTVIGGSDLTWRETKDHQKGVGDHAGCLAAETGLTAFEAAEAVGATHALEAALGFGAMGYVAALTPVGAFGLGALSLHEAHVEGKEQADALRKDDAHVALLANLKLPDSFKTFRFEDRYANVQRDGKTVQTLTARLGADAKGVLVLQLHADRGMAAARDCLAAGASRDAFLAASPKVAAAYRSDPAFHEGFDAWLFAHGKLPEAGGRAPAPDDAARMKQDLERRDARYDALQVPIAV